MSKSSTTQIVVSLLLARLVLLQNYAVRCYQVSQKPDFQVGVKPAFNTMTPPLVHNALADHQEDANVRDIAFGLSSRPGVCPSSFQNSYCPAYVCSKQNYQCQPTNKTDGLPFKDCFAQCLAPVYSCNLTDAKCYEAPPGFGDSMPV